MRYYRTCICFFVLIVFPPFLFAGCGKADMNRAIQQLLFEARNDYKIPGAQISVLCPGENTTHDFVSGYANIQQKIPMRPQHLGQVGSETKAFVAAIILQLESEGKLSIHDAIGQYIPNLPPSWQRVTIRQMLNHTSGIPDYVTLPNFISTLKATDGSKEWSYEEIIAFVKNKGLNFRPGGGWKYSQTNYVLAGKLIEEVTQQPLESELNARILSPLHLNETLYHPAPYSDAVLERMAHGYSHYGLFPNEPKDITGYNLSWINAAGAMLSTAHDKGVWIKALFTGKVLPPAQQKELQQLVDIESGRQLPVNGNGNGYGYGIGIVGTYNSFMGPVWGSAGRTLGYYTGTFYLECKDIVVSYSFNHVGAAESNGMARFFIFKILNTLQSLVPKNCPNMKAQVGSEGIEFLKAIDFDTFTPSK